MIRNKKFNISSIFAIKNWPRDFLIFIMELQNQKKNNDKKNLSHF